LQVNNVNGIDKIYLSGTSIGGREKIVVELNADAALVRTIDLLIHERAC